MNDLFPTFEPSFSALWQDYWGARWHHPVVWPDHRLSCFLTAEAGRLEVNRSVVADYPRRRRPFLGALTNAPGGTVSPESGVLEYNDDGHLLTIAPTRAGKGVSQIVPNLILYGGSCMVIDIKGENYAITQRHRREVFEGARVIKFAPFSDDTDRYNPLDFIRVQDDGRPTSDTFDDVRLLAEMLIGSKATDTFWELEARGLLSMLLLHVATDFPPGDGYRCLGTVLDILFPIPIPSPSAFDEASTTDAAKRKDTAFEQQVELIRLAAEVSDNTLILGFVTQFLEHEDKVRNGILSTCRSAMNIWRSPRLQAATDRSTFQFSDLKRSMCRPFDDSPAPTTIYLIIPPEYLREYRPVLRTMVGLAVTEMTRESAWATPDSLATGWRAKPPCPVLFLLDEFPSLGYMAPIEQGVAYLAGYGVQLWTFAQSIGQLKEIYKQNWSTFVANAGAACYYGMADADLCEFLSGQLGKTGEYSLRYFTSSETEGYSTSNSGSQSSGSSSSYGDSYSSGSSSGDSTSWSDSSSTSKTITEQIRFKDDPVATPSDIRAMPYGSQIVLMRHTLPALARLVPYHKCPVFEGRYDEWNP